MKKNIGRKRNVENRKREKDKDNEHKINLER